MARRNRITFGTQMNQHSSRSHALLCISVEGTDLATGSKTTGNEHPHLPLWRTSVHRALYESYMCIRGDCDSGSRASCPKTKRLRVQILLRPSLSLQSHCTRTASYECEWMSVDGLFDWLPGFCRAAVANILPRVLINNESLKSAIKSNLFYLIL